MNYTVCGYNIKILHDRQLTIAKEVFKICEQNNLKCSLYGGSILGAIRHKGFIPWDHDIDLCMPRLDYEKFVKIMKKQDHPFLFLSEFRTEKRYPNSWAKVRLKGTIFQESELESIKELHNGVFVDLHPIDNVSRFTLKFQVKATMFWTCVSKVKSKIYAGKRYKKNIYSLFSILPYSVINFFRLFSMTMFKNIKTKYVYKIAHPNNGVYLIKRSMFEDLINVKFENEMFFIPREYEEFLSKRYGDYMKYPPESENEICCSTISKCVL